MLADELSPEFLEMIAIVAATMAGALAIMILVSSILEHMTKRHLAAIHRNRTGCECKGVRFKPWETNCGGNRNVGRYICKTCGRTIG